MTSTLTPVLDTVTVPADEPAAAPARSSDPTAGCAVLTLAVLSVAVTDPEHPMWAAAALALASVTVGWAGRSAFDTAWAALRRGGLAAETLTAAGLLAMLVAPVATALHGPIDLIPAVAAAAAATLHCAGEAIAARIERAPGVREMVDTARRTVPTGPGRSSERTVGRSRWSGPRTAPPAVSSPSSSSWPSQRSRSGSATVRARRRR